MNQPKTYLVNETKDGITCDQLMEAIHGGPLFNQEIKMEDILFIQEVKNPMVRVMYNGELMCEVHKSEILDLLK